MIRRTPPAVAGLIAYDLKVTRLRPHRACPGARPFGVDEDPGDDRAADHHRPPFRSTNIMSTTNHHQPAEAVAVEYIAPTLHEPAARIVVRCPRCQHRDQWGRPTDKPKLHSHGLGVAGQTPDLRGRGGHCFPGSAYDITDPDGLVPSVIETVEVVAP